MSLGKREFRPQHRPDQESKAYVRKPNLIFPPAREKNPEKDPSEEKTAAEKSTSKPPSLSNAHAAPADSTPAIQAKEEAPSEALADSLPEEKSTAQGSLNAAARFISPPGEPNTGKFTLDRETCTFLIDGKHIVMKGLSEHTGEKLRGNPTISFNGSEQGFHDFMRALLTTYKQFKGRPLAPTGKIFR